MDEPVDTGEQQWPSNCPVCGTRMASAVIDFDKDNENRAEFQPGEMVAVDYCPNPDCPGKNAESPQPPSEP